MLYAGKKEARHTLLIERTKRICVILTMSCARKTNTDLSMGSACNHPPKKHQAN